MRINKTELIKLIDEHEFAKAKDYLANNFPTYKSIAELYSISAFIHYKLNECEQTNIIFEDIESKFPNSKYLFMYKGLVFYEQSNINNAIINFIKYFDLKGADDDVIKKYSACSLRILNFDNFQRLSLKKSVKKVIAEIQEKSETNISENETFLPYFIKDPIQNTNFDVNYINNHKRQPYYLDLHYYIILFKIKNKDIVIGLSYMKSIYEFSDYSEMVDFIIDKQYIELLVEIIESAKKINNKALNMRLFNLLLKIQKNITKGELDCISYFLSNKDANGILDILSTTISKNFIIDYVKREINSEDSYKEIDLNQMQNLVIPDSKPFCEVLKYFYDKTNYFYLLNDEKLFLLQI